SGQTSQGGCTGDSQCTQGYYCDFTLSYCAWDGGPVDPRFAVVSDGRCLQDCGDSCPKSCHIGEDCGPAQLCVGWSVVNNGESGRPCTSDDPCDAGVCSNVPCPGPPLACPNGCAIVS